MGESQKNQNQIPKQSIEQPHDTGPRDISLGNLFSDPKSCRRDSWTFVFTAALFKIARKCTRCPSADEYTKFMELRRQVNQ